MVSRAHAAIIGNRYVLEEPIGQGAMGIVFKAKDRLTGNMVALKQLPLEEQIDESALEEYRTAIIREFQFLATLRHPNIITVYDFGFDSNHHPYFVMELLEKAYPVTQVTHKSTEIIADRFVQILRTLQYLHRRGIAHCDLKPANVLVANNQVKLLDLGLSRLLSETTVPGGTIAYLPYEIVILLLSETTDAPDIDYAKVDLYSAGAIGYEMNTGHPPFFDDDLETLAVMILETVPDMTGTQPFTPVFARLLQKEPGQRYPDAKSAICDLSQITGIPSLETETDTVRESFLQAATFVGRKAELTQLTGAIKRAMAGQGSAWLIGGESGIGKSRLVNEIAIHASVKGFLVLRGQAISEGGGAYQLWRSLLRQLCINIDVGELDAQVIKTLVPDIDQLLDRPVYNPPSVDPKTAQERLLSVIERLFRQYTGPLMVLLEDLQWVDQESLIVLSRLLRLIPHHPMFIVGTYRNDETSDLLALLPEMDYMPLNRLQETDITQLSEVILGEAGKQANFINWLQSETEGHVFFLVEILRSLAASAGQLDAIGKTFLPEHVSTLNIEAIVQRRLRRVSRLYRSLLEAAAIIGRQIDIPVMQQIDRETDITRWLFECTEASVLEVYQGTWRFSHDKIRDELLRSLSTERRLELHRQASEAIEGSSGETQAVALAYHWHMAGDKRKEVYYSGLAGERALQSGANQEAQQYFRQALEVDIQQCNGIADEQRKLNWARWERGIGETCLWSGNMSESHHHIQKTLELLDFPEPQQKYQLLSRIARSIAVQIFHRALPRRWSDKQRANAPQLLEAANAYCRAAEIHYYAGHNTLMVLAVFSALNLAERSGQISLALVWAYGNASVVTAYLNLSRVTRFFLRKSLEAANKLNQPFALSQALTRNAMYSVAHGEWRSTDDFCQQALALEKQIGAERYWRETTSLTSTSLYWQGQYEQSLRSLLDMYHSGQRAGDIHYEAMGLIWRVPALQALGKWDEALTLLYQARTLLLNHPDDKLINVRTMKASLFALTNLRKGFLEQAKEQLLQAVDLIISHPLAAYTVLISVSASLETLLNLPDHDRVDSYDVIVNKLLRVLHKYTKSHPVGSPALECWHGLADWQAGRKKLALKHWSHGLEAAYRLKMPYEIGLLHFEMGRHLSHSDPSRLSHLKQAQHAFGKIGAQFYLDQVLREIGSSLE